MENKTLKRSPLPDIMKGLAVILMIQVHLMELFTTQDVYHGFLGKMSLFLGGLPAAPVFMAVMGYFIAISTKSLQTDIYRGVKLLLWGLLLNIGMNFHLLIKIINGSIQLNPWPYIFGVDILFLAGLSVIILALCKRLFKKHLTPWTLLAIFASLGNTIIPEYVGANQFVHYAQAFITGHAHWSYFPLFPWVVYPTLGVIYYLLDKKYQFSDMTLKGQVYIAAISLGVSIGFGGFGFSISTDLQAYYTHPFLFVLWAVAFLVFWLILIKLISHSREHLLIFQYLGWVGRKVTAFYVVQWLIIGNIATAIYRTQHGLAFMLWFFVIVLITSILVRIWESAKVRIMTPGS